PAALAGFALAARALPALGIAGVLAGFPVGLPPLFADALAIVAGVLGALFPGAAFGLPPPAFAAFALFALFPFATFAVVLAASASGAGLHQHLGLVEPLGALGGIIDLIGLAFDRDGEVVDDLALGVQRLVQVAARVPFLQG